MRLTVQRKVRRRDHIIAVGAFSMSCQSAGLIRNASSMGKGIVSGNAIVRQAEVRSGRGRILRQSPASAHEQAWPCWENKD